MKNFDTSRFNHFQRLLRDSSIALVSRGLVGDKLWKKYRRLRTVRLHAIALLATALICCVAGGPVAAQTASPPVILINSGSTSAPDGSIYILDSVMVPVINASGQIAFRAILSGTSSPTGIIAGTPGSLQIVARVGDAAPSGGNYNVLNDPVFNSNGQVAFVANTSGNGNGQFARTLGFPTTTAALVGTASPTGNNYSALNALPVVNASGQVAFVANLNGAASQGIFAGTPGTTLATAALLNNAAPAGGNYQQLTNPAINAAGKVLFRASLTGGTAGSGVFYGTPGTTLTTVALQGAASPAGGNYGNFSGAPTVNSAGQVAIISDVGLSNIGLFAGTAGTTLTTVAISGSAAPTGGNYSVSGFGNPALNAAGTVAFNAGLTGGSSNRGIFVGTPGQTLQTIALNGGNAPNGGGATYSNLFGNPSLNASGQVAFVTNLAGTGVNSSNNFGLYAGTPGNVVNIVRTGDLVDVDPGPAVDNRLVSAITFLSSLGSVTDSGGQDGRISGFNDSGFLIYRLDFTSGGRGIFTSSIAPVSTPGDFNGDGTVDAADYVVWRKDPTSHGGTPGGYNTWRTNFGKPAPGSGSGSLANGVPEPSTLVLLMFLTASSCIRRGRAHRDSRELINA